MIKLDDAYLREIVSKTIYLSECNSKDIVCSKNDKSEQRLEYWKQKVGKDKFANRLKLENISYERALELCGDIKFVGNVFPNWVNTLKNIFKLLPTTYAEIKKYFYPNYKREIPAVFQNCFLIFAFYAKQNLNDFSDRISDDVINKLSGELINRLSNIAFSAIQYYCFDTVYKKHSKDMTLEECMKLMPCDLLYSGEYLELFEEYPLLARLLCECVDTWIKNMNQMFTRITNDINACGKLINAFGDISDLHAEGKCVYVLEFENNKKLVYKPHSLKTDIVWKEFCTKFYEFTNIKINYVEAKDYNNYGYTEFIEYKGVENKQHLKKFFKNAGMLLCLTYAIGANDMNLENLIENGTDLYIIDTETIIGYFNKDYNIRKTGFLVIEKDVKNVFTVNTIFDLAGLTGVKDGSKNLPILDNKVYTAKDFIDEICDGFEFLYDKLLKLDDEQIKQLKNIITDCSIRYILRATVYYYNMICITNLKEYLKDSFLYFCEIERFSNLDIDDYGSYFNVYLSERNALLKRDIPIFYNKKETSDLYDDKKIVKPNFFKDTLKNSDILTFLNKQNKLEQLNLIKQILSK